MAGPVTMTLGRFAFEAFGFGYDGIQRTLDTQWSAVPVAGGLDALQYLGPTVEDTTISGCLFPERFGGMATLDGLRGAATRGEILTLANLEGRIFGPHVIQQISEDRYFMTRLGLPRKLVYHITLTRYQRRNRAG